MKQLSVSVAEFCEITGIKKTKTYELIRNRELQVVKIGRRTLIPCQSIDALLSRHTVSGPSTLADNDTL